MAITVNEDARDTFPRERYATPAMTKQINAAKAIKRSKGSLLAMTNSFLRLDYEGIYSMRE
jgi:hypothetical protein